VGEQTVRRGGYIYAFPAALLGEAKREELSISWRACSFGPVSRNICEVAAFLKPTFLRT
jgi:hypothetical protein